MALEGAGIDLLELDARPARGLGAIEVGTGIARQPLPLARVAVAARVAARFAEVTITQVFRNTYTDAIEAVYTFPLDGGAVVSRFELQVGERILHGLVAERAAAREQYQQALAAGKRAALLEQERDDVFTVQLGNLPPGEDATIRLTYSEELTFFDDGLTELRLPLVLGLRYVPGEPLAGESAGHGTAGDTDLVPDASRITPPRLADGFDPRVDLSITVDVEGSDLANLACSQHATRLRVGGGRTTITLARADERLDRDFVLRWRVAERAAIAPALFFYRRPSGERYGIVSLGAGAGIRPVTPRDVVFVLDRSGSMEGSKIASAARACGLLLATLGPADRFGILVFNERAQWLMGGAGGGSLLRADQAGISRGERELRGVDANGGTEMHQAIQAALDQLARREDATGRVPVVILITDGQVGDESRVLELVQRAQARVFTVGVDTSVNSGLLKRVAQAGRGTFVLTEPGAALDEALAAIAREIGAPVVEGLGIAVDGGTVTDVAPERLPDLFAGRAATIAFRADTGSTARITGRRADGSAFAIDVTGSELELPAIAHLWARRRLTDLEDRYRLAREDKQALEARIVALSTSHSVLSRFTAFVVVDDRQAVVAPEHRRTIVQPVEMPHLWARQAPGQLLIADAALSPVTASVEQAMRDAAPLASRMRTMTLRRSSGSFSAPPPTDDRVTAEIAAGFDGLLQALSEGPPAQSARDRYAAALDAVERLLDLLDGRGRHRRLRALTSALRTLRDRLRAAVSADHEVEVATTQLRDLWAEMSAPTGSRGRFWGTV